MKKENKVLKNKAFRRYYFLKLIFNIVFILIVVGLTTLFIERVQNESTRRRQIKMSNDVLNSTIEMMDSNASVIEELKKDFNSNNQQSVFNIELLFESGAFSNLAEMSLEESVNFFAKIKKDAGINYLFLIDNKGSVVLTDEMKNVGGKLNQLLSDNNIKEILSNTNTKKGTTEYITNKDGSISRNYLPVNARFTIENVERSFNFYSYPICAQGTDEVYVDPNGVSYFILLGADTALLDNQLYDLTNIQGLIDSITIGEDGFLFAIDKLTGKFIYFDDGESTLTDKLCIDVGLDYKKITDESSQVLDFNNNSYFCVTRNYNSETYGSFMLISAAVTSQSLYETDRMILSFTIALISLCVYSVLIYCVFVNNDFLRTKKIPNVRLLKKTKNGAIYFNRSISKHLLGATFIALIVIFIFSFFIQTYFTTSKTTSESYIALDEISTQYAKDSSNNQYVEDYYEKLFISKAKQISYILEEDPSALKFDKESSDVHKVKYQNDLGEYVDSVDEYGNIIYSSAYNKSMIKLCDINNADFLYVYNDKGQVISTNASKWYGTITIEKGFGDVLSGKVPYMFLKETIDEDDELYRYAASFNYYTYNDNNGHTIYVNKNDYQNYLDGTWTGEEITKHRSLVEISYTSSRFMELVTSNNIEDVLSQIQIANNGKLVVVSNSEGNEVLFSFNKSDIGKKALDLGFSNNFFKSNYKGFMNVEGTNYYVVSRFVDGFYAAIFTPTKAMYADRASIILINIIAVILCILFLSGMFTLHTEIEQKAFTTVKWESEYDAELETIYITMPSGKKKKVVAASNRWNDATIPWKRKTSEAKIFIILQTILLLLTTIMIFYFSITNSKLDRDALIVYILFGGIDRGFNFFSFSTMFIAILVYFSLLTILDLVTIIIASTSGTRVETLGKLIVAIIKLLTIIALILYGLYLVGLNTTSLLASAGIMSIVIGLGAQSLIGDILAGIFIVMEGSFRVGDIITLGDYRGQVIEIGLRTTKVQDIFNNIKVYNNSAITGVLNMTKENSIAKCSVGIEYDEDIDKLEEIFKAELPLVKSKIPSIIEGPYYLGITSFDASSINILIIALCNEQQRIQLERDLNKEIFLIFRKYNINIPYPQVTISYRNDSITNKEFEEARNNYEKTVLDSNEENIEKDEKESQTEEK